MVGWRGEKVFGGGEVGGEVLGKGGARLQAKPQCGLKVYQVSYLMLL